MPRINEHTFKLKNEEYKLTLFDKPRITKNGRQEIPYTLAKNGTLYLSDFVTEQFFSCPIGMYDLYFFKDEKRGLLLLVEGGWGILKINKLL
jgi:hypothetical protein